MDCFFQLGCLVEGVDTNHEYVRRAQNQGFTAYNSDIFFKKNHIPFDVVFLSHLVEHVSPDSLASLIPKLCALLSEHGRLIIVSPTPGERFYHDFSHIRPYLPQSIRHAFGATGMPISFGESALIELVDIYFFKDPYRTRHWRSFYMKTGFCGKITTCVNRIFDCLWRLSLGHIGAQASWLGIYELRPITIPPL